MTNESDPEDGLDDSRRDVLASVGSDSAETNTDRRSVLRGAAATALATVGFTSTAAALDPTGRVELDLAKRPFESRDAAVAAVESHGQAVLDLLADHGHLDRADADALDWYVSAWRVNGTATARIDSRTDLDGGQLRISVEPQNGRAYAVDSSGDEWTIFDAETGEVRPMDCTITTACLDSFDCYTCEVTEICCDDGGCHVGAGTGTCCSSCDTACGC